MPAKGITGGENQGPFLALVEERRLFFEKTTIMDKATSQAFKPVEHILTPPRHFTSPFGTIAKTLRVSIALLLGGLR